MAATLNLGMDLVQLAGFRTSGEDSLCSSPPPPTFSERRLSASPTGSVGAASPFIAAASHDAHEVGAEDLPVALSGRPVRPLGEPLVSEGPVVTGDVRTFPNHGASGRKKKDAAHGPVLASVLGAMAALPCATLDDMQLVLKWARDKREGAPVHIGPARWDALVASPDPGNGPLDRFLLVELPAVLATGTGLPFRVERVTTAADIALTVADLYNLPAEPLPHMHGGERVYQVTWNGDPATAPEWVDVIVDTAPVDPGANHRGCRGKGLGCIVNCATGAGNAPQGQAVFLRGPEGSARLLQLLPEDAPERQPWASTTGATEPFVLRELTPICATVLLAVWYFASACTDAVLPSDADGRWDVETQVVVPPGAFDPRAAAAEIVSAVKLPASKSSGKKRSTQPTAAGRKPARDKAPSLKRPVPLVPAPGALAGAGEEERVKKKRSVPSEPHVEACAVTVGGSGPLCPTVTTDPPVVAGLCDTIRVRRVPHLSVRALTDMFRAIQGSVCPASVAEAEGAVRNTGTSTNDVLLEAALVDFARVVCRLSPEVLERFQAALY